MRRIALALPFALLAACGIPGDTLLTDLDDKDAELICKRAVDEEATDRTVSCGDPIGDVVIPASTMQDCLDYFAAVHTVANPDCTADLDTWVTCKEEPELTDDQVCGVEAYEPSAECIAVAVCVTPATAGTPTE